MGWFGPYGNCSCNCGNCVCDDGYLDILAIYSQLSVTLDADTETSLLPEAVPDSCSHELTLQECSETAGHVAISGGYCTSGGIDYPIGIFRLRFTDSSYNCDGTSGTSYKGGIVTISVGAACVDGQMRYSLYASYSAGMFASGEGDYNPSGCGTTDYWLTNPKTNGLTYDNFTNGGFYGMLMDIDMDPIDLAILNTELDYSYVGGMKGVTSTSGGSVTDVSANLGSSEMNNLTEYGFGRVRSWYVDDLANFPSGPIDLTPLVNPGGQTVTVELS